MFISLFYFFFFKQKTAYEMLRSLVGSEMCIRDSLCLQAPKASTPQRLPAAEPWLPTLGRSMTGLVAGISIPSDLAICQSHSTAAMKTCYTSISQKAVPSGTQDPFVAATQVCDNVIVRHLFDPRDSVPMPVSYTHLTLPTKRIV
eukprot:TRINITY_DN63028_c0_g1_i1.p1 TRINITY_DN63028_c0_g1~~TRINITY_DN63028_c0_g1_i1.p1  ORF type:complete len:145 (-),score=33.60 TRINITY_DN63028_c0_g1_i1:164-598(-)